ncbi:tetratricopeptide repeat protein [Streptomyces sp. NPDC059696]|uniref:tetratricopeptide repeat protein n=1 Tax=Streptomyces sp. NPDC059696 TaxID=3346911 RepID=UPI0036B47FDF
MSRLSREKKREQKQAAHAATPAAPIDVHVPRAGTDVGGGAAGGSDGASVGGVPVFAAPGEEIQRAVLNRLHHIALATGHPVLATIRDERIGYVVPLQVDPDGSSHFTSEPIATPPRPQQHPRGPETPTAQGPQQAGVAEVASAQGPQQARVADTASAQGPQQAAVTDSASTQGPQQARLADPARAQGPQHTPGAGITAPPAEPPHPPAEPPHSPAEPPHPSAEPPHPPAEPAHPSAEPPHPSGDMATHVLRPASASGRGSAPTFRLRAVPEPQPAAEPVPTFELRAVPESTTEPAPQDAPPAPDTATPPGTVAPPTGAFGPPPPMDARPLPVPEAQPAPRPAPAPEDALIAADPDPKPTPPRGFDAVAEAVLGDEPLTAPGASDAPALLAEPVGRINEAVKEGRIEAAAGLAEQTLVQASGTLGPEHPEVLRLGELTAYIAYLAGDPLRAFRLSLDLAGARRRAGDAEAAYGNVESAATAWRAVRDPALGLDLGRDLIGLWTELAAEDGPAAEEVEQLESARARMGRLTARARNR